MFVKVTGKCPHCDVRKHQIDTSEEHAIEVLDKAFAEHISENHPDVVISPAKEADRG